ncbi:MAG: abortive infection system antitoxin AbiGi family protein [Chitinophagaceae bacterium]
MAKISQNLSSDSLFHFVHRRDWLLEILQRKAFQARFVYEDIPALKQKLGIPMKCFSDIPLGMIKKHMTVYGAYGIGVTKTFAKRNNLSPIIYVHQKSAIINRYLTNIKNFKTLNSQNSLIPYFKMEEGYITNSKGKQLRKRFYDEREWRYVPFNAIIIDFDGFDEDEIRKTRLNYENDQLISSTAKYLLPIEYKDITYIFVQGEEDVNPLIKSIKSLGLKNEEVVDNLIAKIVTARQIERDF